MNKEVPFEAVKASDVLNVKVRSNLNEDLGKIEEIILDKVSGYVHYVVLSFGGFLGMGDKLFAFPWNAISYDKRNECFILNISKNKLENAPGFDKEHWPDWSDKLWRTSIYDYYGTKPFTDE